MEETGVRSKLKAPMWQPAISLSSSETIPVVLFAAFMLPVFALLYYGFLDFYYVGDDYVFLRSYSSVASAFEIPRGNYHYVPIGWLAASFPSPLFGENLLVANLSTIFLHFTACCFVFLLARAFFDNLLVGFQAGLLFSTYYLSSQVIYWKTGKATSAATIFAILSFLFYKRFSESRSKKSYFAFNVFFLLGFLSIEYAALILPLCFLYDGLLKIGTQGKYWKDRLRDLLVKRWSALLIPVLMLSIILFLRISHGVFISPAHERGSLIRKGIFPVAIQACMNLAYFRYFINVRQQPEMAAFAIVLACIAIVVLSIRALGMRLIFFAGWAFGLTFIIIVGSGAFVGPERYFYLPAAGFAVFFSSAVYGTTAPLINNKRFLPGLAHRKGLVVVLVVTALLFPFELHGFRVLKMKQGLWHLASDTHRNLIDTFIEIYTQSKDGSEFYLVNLPDSLRIIGEEFPVARNGFANGVLFRLGKNINAKLHYVKLPPDAQPKKFLVVVQSQRMEMPDVQKLAEDSRNVVLVFDEDQLDLVRFANYWGVE